LGVYTALTEIYLVVSVFMEVAPTNGEGMTVLSSKNLEEYTKERLWQLLIETVHTSVMYPTHKAYTRDSILPQKPDVSAVELAERLGMSLGEALVILDELKQQAQSSL
jgi:hypothetical protein